MKGSSRKKAFRQVPPSTNDTPVVTKSVDTTVSDKKWLAEVTRHIPRSARALNHVLKAGAKTGVDDDYLVFLLYQYCRSAEELSVTSRREAARFAASEARKILNACETLTAALQRAEADVLTRGLASLANSPRMGLVSALTRYTTILGRLKADNDAKASRKRSGPDDWWLFLLSEEIRVKTGRPHHGKLANLLNVGLELFGWQKRADSVLTAKDIQTRINRFRKSFPDEAHSISSFII